MHPGNAIQHHPFLDGVSGLPKPVVGVGDHFSGGCQGGQGVSNKVIARREMVQQLPSEDEVSAVLAQR